MIERLSARARCSPGASWVGGRVVRDMVFSHLSHHRAQPGVYLRLNDIPLPGTYGPSADEQMF